MKLRPDEIINGGCILRVWKDKKKLWNVSIRVSSTAALPDIGCIWYCHQDTKEKAFSFGKNIVTGAYLGFMYLNKAEGKGVSE